MRQSLRRRGPFRPDPGGLLHEVLRNKRTGHLADIRATRAYAERDPSAVAAVKLGGVRALLAVPMLKDDELIGLISIYRQEVRPLTKNRLSWSKISPLRRSSPSKTRGCSTSCASALPI